MQRRSLGHARADNAADIFRSRNRALCKALAHRRAGLARNAADIVAGIARNAAEAIAVRDQAEIHPSTDAAGVAALGLYLSFVRTALNDGFQLVLTLIL